jgi:hypothetical protein
MLTGEIRSQIDAIWNAFWTGGISNPLEVIEQITYLLFLRRLDDLQTLEELKAQRLKKPIERRIFPEGKDPKKMPYEQLRWSKFKNLEAREMYTVVSEHVFPFLRTLGGDESTYAHHMKDARFTIPTPALLARVVDLLDHVPVEDRDTKGDLYEYMLGKIASAGQNGQFRTPRHIIRLMVEMVAPKPTDIVCDPACGTCGFLVAVGEYLRERHPESLSDPSDPQEQIIPQIWACRRWRERHIALKHFPLKRGCWNSECGATCKRCGYVCIGDWKVMRTLTINLGARVEVNGQPSEVDGRVSNFFPQFYVAPPAGGFTSPATSGFVLPDNYSGYAPPGFHRGNPTLLDNPVQTHVEPRVGFAWLPFSSQNFVVRGGYGIYANRTSFAGNGFLLALQPPFALSVALNGGGYTWTATVPGRVN